VNWEGNRVQRAVAQFGSARRSGRRGRRFKSGQPDEVKVWVALANAHAGYGRRREMQEPSIPSIAGLANNPGSPEEPAEVVTAPRSKRDERQRLASSTLASSALGDASR
jgi:hypothetical protein